MVPLYLILPVQALLPIDDPEVWDGFELVSGLCKTTPIALALNIYEW